MAYHLICANSNSDLPPQQSEKETLAQRSSQALFSAIKDRLFPPRFSIQLFCSPPRKKDGQALQALQTLQAQPVAPPQGQSSHDQGPQKQDLYQQRGPPPFGAFEPGSLGMLHIRQQLSLLFRPGAVVRLRPVRARLRPVRAALFSALPALCGSLCASSAMRAPPSMRLPPMRSAVRVPRLWDPVLRTPVRLLSSVKGKRTRS